MPDEQTNTLTAALAHATTVRFQTVPDANAPRLKARAHAAIERAIALRRMQQEYANTGFLAVPLDEYLNRLARMAGVPLPMSAPAPTERTSVAALKPWLGLAGALEMAASHVRLWVRSWFAAAAAPSGMRLAAARNASSVAASGAGQGERLSPSEADAALTAAEQSYPAAMRNSLQAALRLIP